MTGFSLGPRARAAGIGLRAFDQTGSTNAEALEAARAGELGPMWFVTAEQTAGRGRRGRSWSHPRGNLGATFLRSVKVPPATAATLGFVAGLSLHAALRQHLRPDHVHAALDGAEGEGGADRFTLKWPNDVVAGDAKLAGILLESTPLEGGRLAVVVGIGVNVVAAPEGLPYPATSLAALGMDATAATVFAALSDAWIAFEALWDEGRGLPPLRVRWLERAAGVGAPVAVKLGNDVIRGIFETLDDDGRLVVRTPDGRRVEIAAGDVHFGAVASAAAEEV